MITVSILINGEPIYTRSAVRRDKLKKIGNKTPYLSDDGILVYHNHKDGAVKLAKMLLDTIHEV